jgi:Ni,Fe-hydrogenase III small subunit
MPPGRRKAFSDELHRRTPAFRDWAAGTHSQDVRLTDFDAHARANHGIVTFGGSGLSRSAWYRAIAAGTLDQIHPLVARMPGTPDTPEQRIAAGVSAMGRRHSHRTVRPLDSGACPGPTPIPST